MKKIYISGKISGLNISRAYNKFKTTENYLIKKGFEVINPMKQNLGSWNEYMIKDIEMLFGCDAIFMQKDWKESKGARIEFAIAVEMGKEIFFE